MTSPFARLARVSPWVPVCLAQLLSACGSLPVDPDGDGFPAERGDCDNQRRDSYPGALELCDGRDNNCSGREELNEADADGDGVRVCAGDCDDQQADTYPGAEERCDQRDNDCDGVGDVDRDQDGSCLVADCPETAAGSCAEHDCNDEDAEVRPGYPELCDGKDNDCDGSLEAGDQDQDRDGHSICSGRDPNDCNDLNGTIYPGALETCNGLDEDCDGQPDEGFDVDQDGTSDCVDDDLDGFMEAGIIDDASESALNTVDCDDRNHVSYPGAIEVGDGRDNDCDGVVDDGVTLGSDRDLDGVAWPEDCDDGHTAIYPGAQEVCNGRDDDCDLAVDEGVGWLLYLDQDGDGLGGSSSKEACGEGPGQVKETGDCDDSDPTIFPGALEQCNGLDDDCDGHTDEDLLIIPYTDQDQDGVGGTSAAPACSLSPGQVITGGDCDDQDAAVYPGAEESCDGRDNNCDGLPDYDLSQASLPVDALAWYLDHDEDGFGADDAVLVSCTPPAGRVSRGGDCDDYDPAVHPEAEEACNGQDDDCDGDSETLGDYFVDADGDGYGLAGYALAACVPPPGYAAQAGDCNDSAAAVNPGATEVCNAVDDDCDGTALGPGLFYPDYDGDGFGSSQFAVSACTAPAGYVRFGADCDDQDAAAYPGAVERCQNQTDDDCNGAVDEARACRLNPVWVVTVDGVHPYTGVPETSLLSSIQAAIAGAASGDVIAVGPGIYSEKLDFLGKDVQVVGWEGPQATLLEGGWNGSMAVFSSGEGPQAVLEGFTLTRGAGSGEGRCGAHAGILHGGGVCIDGASPTLRHLVITRNFAHLGGGVYVNQGGASLEDVVISSNTAFYSGTDGGFGAGLLAEGMGTVTLKRLLIQGNLADVGSGGGLAILAQPLVEATQLILRDNVASQDGGGAYVSGTGALSLTQAVVAGNVSRDRGGGLFFLNAGLSQLARSIVAFNSDEAGGPNVFGASEGLSISLYYNCYFAEDAAGVVGLEVGAQDRVLDPGFVDDPRDGSLEDDDYHLAGGSSLVDGGPSEASAEDADGSRNDPGAYGGEGGAWWDLDGDGYALWFWPGSYAEPPDLPAYQDSGSSLYVDPASFDCDDGDPEVYPGQGCE